MLFQRCKADPLAILCSSSDAWQGFIGQTRTTQRLFNKRVPARNIVHVFCSITGEIFSSVDILLTVAMKLINWGEWYLTVNKPLDLCRLSCKFRHSFCKTFSLPYPSASLPPLFTAPWWHLFASSGPSCLSFASHQRLVPLCSPSQFGRIPCLTAAVPPPLSHHPKPVWGFLPGWRSSLLCSLGLAPNRVLLGITVVA